MNAIISGKQEAPVGSMTWEKVYDLDLSKDYSQQEITQEQYANCHVRTIDLTGAVNFIKINRISSRSDLGAQIYFYKEANPSSSGLYCITYNTGIVYISAVTIAYILNTMCKSIEIGYLKIS